MSAVQRHQDGVVVTLTIDRPEAYNALNAEVVADLASGVAEAEADPQVRAVVITGSGEKAFCAGADLKELDGASADRAFAVTAEGQRVLRAIELCEVPVIAAVNGLALGGGFELVLACAFPVLSENAAFGLPESGLGLIPGYGGTQRLPRLVGKQVAAHLMLTGHRLDARRAYELGLTPVEPVVPDRLLATAHGIAETVARQGPQAVRSILRAIGLGQDASLDAGLALETGLASLAVAGAESSEGIAAFLQKRPAAFGDDPRADS